MFLEHDSTEILLGSIFTASNVNVRIDIHQYLDSRSGYNFIHVAYEFNSHLSLSLSLAREKLQINRLLY